MRYRFANLLCMAAIVLPCLIGCKSLNFDSPFGGKKKNLFGLRNTNQEVDSDELLDPLGQRSTNRLLLDDLSFNQIGTTFKVRSAIAEDRQGAEESYTAGRQLYDQAISNFESAPKGSNHLDLFTEAANKFRVAAAKYPGSETEHDALFFEGESYFFANRYVQANRAFEKLLVKYSGSRYLDKAEARRFAIAQYWLQLAETQSKFVFNDSSRPKMDPAGEARRILHRIRLDDPTGKLADDATLALANAYFADERWYEAADTYEDLRNNYPGSKHQFHAHLFELKSRMNSYRGHSYDDAPITKADKIMKSIVQQFPEQARTEEEYLAKEAAMIRNLLAEREWSMGQYFENRGENRAAQIYYQRVVKDFGDTEFAANSLKQIDSISTKPDVPTQYAKWLVDVFPKTEKAKPVIASNPLSTKLR